MAKSTLSSTTTRRCRLCLNVSNEVISIFREDFSKMIKLLTSIQVQQADDLPKAACIPCTKKVKAAMNIRKQIIRSHRTLIEETLTKKSKSRILASYKNKFEDYSNASLENNDQDKIKEESGVVLLDDIDIKDEIKMEPVEDVPISSPNCEFISVDKQIHEQLNQTSIQNLPVPVNNEISIVKVNKTKCNGATIIKTLHSINERVQTRSSTKYQPQSSVVMKTNAQQVLTTNNSTLSELAKRQNYHKSLHTKIDQLTPVPCEICQKLVLKTNMSRHLQIHDIKMVTCDICGIVTKNTNLRYHIYYAHKCKADEYVCDQCGSHFRYRHRFKLHMKKVHGGSKDFECTTCGRKFFERRFLNIHIDAHHKKIRPYVCDYCGKNFSTRRILKVHLRQHTESAPYTCDTCGLNFKQKVSLRTHRQQAHDVYEEETVFCEVCGKGFASQVALKSHFVLHERKKCVHCSEVFARDDYLERHIKDKHGTHVNPEDSDKLEVMEMKNVSEDISNHSNERN